MLLALKKRRKSASWQKTACIFQSQTIRTNVFIIYNDLNTCKGIQQKTSNVALTIFDTKAQHYKNIEVQDTDSHSDIQKENSSAWNDTKVSSLH